MATVRDHAPLFGKDILSRMLDMEKLSQIQRDTSPTAAVLTTSASTNDIPRLSTQKQSMTSPLHNGSMRPPPHRPLPRSTTAPNLTINSSLANSDNEERAVTNLEDEASSPSICHSPTWSIRGREKTKQEEKKAAKEKKDLEKRMKKSEDKKKMQFLKPGKRLSKKPPPAMETQRMPMALSRPSESTATRSRNSSLDRSRPSSKDERRSSVSSLSSMLRNSMPTFSLSRRGSTSQPPTPSPEKSENASPMIKATNVDDKSKSGEGQVTVEQDDEERYLKDLKEFSYQFNGGSKSGPSANASPAKSDFKESPLPSPMPLLDSSGHDTLSFTASAETLSERPVHRDQEKPLSPRPGPRASGIPDNSPRGYHYPTISRSSLEKAPRPSESKSHYPYKTDVGQTVSSPNLSNSTSKPQDSSISYVKRQRLHQQQRSISGFQEEVAVGQAIANIGPNMPPTPDESTESLQQDEKIEKKTGTSRQEMIAPKANRRASDRPKSMQPSKTETSTMGSSKSPTTTQATQPANSSKPRAGRPTVDHARSKSETMTKRVGSRLTESFTVEEVAPLDIVKTNENDEPDTANKKKSKQAAPSKANTKATSDASTEPKSTERRRRGSIIPAAFSFPKFARSSTDPTTARLAQPVPEPTRPQRKQVVEPTETKFETVAKVEQLVPAQPEVPDKSPLRHQRRSLYLEASESQLAAQPKVIEPELVVEGVDGDGLVRKTSVKRSRSDPELNVDTSEIQKPDLDFLPELKHQPLVKPKRTLPAKVSFAPVTESFPVSTAKFPVPASAADFTASKSADIMAVPQPPFATTGPGVARRSAIKASKRATFGSDPSLPAANKAQVASEAVNAKPIAKMFVICCKCKYWHDLPSTLYEAMALPRTISQEDGVAGGASGRPGETTEGASQRAPIKAQVFTNVKCPWCEHGMSTGCCAGWTGIVYLHERHH